MSFSNLAELLLPPAGYYAVLLAVSELVRRLAGAWPGTETLCAALSAAAAIGLFSGMYIRDRKQNGETGQGRPLPFAGGRCAWLLPLLSFALGAAYNLVFSRVMAAAGAFSYFSNETQASLLEAPFFLAFIGLGVLVPAAEELIWRGLFYGRLKRRIGVPAAAAAASLLFALMHGNVIQALYAFPSALILTWCYEAGGGLLYPVLFHMGANMLAVLCR